MKPSILDSIRIRLASWLSKAPGGMALGLMPGSIGDPPRRGTAELLRAYSQMPWLRAVTQKIGRAVGSTEWLAINPRTGEPFETHPIIELLEGGNASMPGSQVMQLVQQYIDIAGEAFIVKERNRAGMPLELWPIPPHWVIGTPFDTIDGSFRISHRGWQTTVPASEIIWIKDPDPLDPYNRGSGVAKSLGDEFETDEFAAKHTAGFFRNRARPDLFLHLKGASKDNASALESKWSEKFGGYSRTRRPLVMGGDFDVTLQEIGQSFEELQMVPLRQFERDTIVQVYGVPPEMLGILANSNRATIESSEFFFTKHVIEPRVIMLRAYLQEKLVPDFGEFELDFVSPVDEDKEFNLRAMTAAPWAYTVNEWRTLTGQDPIDGDDGDLYPMSFSTFFQRDHADSFSDVGNNTDGIPTDSEPKAVKSFVRKDITESDILRIVEPLSNDRIRRAIWLGLGDFIREIVEEFGEEALQQLGQQINFEATHRVREFLEQFAANRSKLIDETTAKEIGIALSEAIAEGQSFEEQVERIRGVFASSTEARARLIARTETTRAANFGQQESFVQAGVGKKEWLCVAPETTLFGFGVSQAASREYSGDIVTLRPAGYESSVRVTPDHKLLTNRGWVCASAVENSDYLISYVGVIDTMGALRAVPDPNNMPSAIEKEFRSLSESVLSARAFWAMRRVPNLDSERRDSYVDVVDVDGQLRRAFEPSCDETIKNLFFMLSDVRAGDLFCDTNLFSDRLGAGWPIDSVFLGYRSYDAINPFGSLVVGLSVEEVLNGLALASGGNSCMSKNGTDDALGTSMDGGNFSHGQPIDILFRYDRCLFKDIDSWSGHVYDLSTSNGWMVANYLHGYGGLIIHNSTRDDLVRDTHKAMDGQVVNVNDDFVSPSGATGPFPGEMSTAADSINCRCLTVSVFDDEERSHLDTEEKRVQAWRGFEARRMSRERSMRRQVRSAFREQEKQVIAIMREISENG